MTLEYFQILNCFGFKDSGKITFEKNGLYTILGKNSSGKTSVLKAIEAFQWGEKISSMPRFKNFNAKLADGELKLKVKFKIEPGDFTEESVLKQVREAFLMSFQVQLNEAEEIPFVDEIYEEIIQNYKKLVSIANKSGNLVIEKNIEDSYSFYSESKNLIIDERKTRIQSTTSNILQKFSDFPSNDANNPTIKWLPRPGKSEIVINVGELLNQIENELFKRFPLIYSFNKNYSLQDNLPEVITNEILNTSPNTLTTEFIKLLGLDNLSEYTNSQDPEEREKIKKGFQVALDNFTKMKFSDSRNINFVKFIVGSSSQALGLSIVVKIDQKAPCSYNQLSENTKYLIAYHIYTSNKELTNSIILFDEPNNGFHSSAQKKLLTFLKQLAEKNIVIISTHSEYLVEPDTIPTIKIMGKDLNNKPLVENNFRSNDLLAFEPIANAIGLKFGHNLLNKKNVVVLEEISAMFYFLAFQKLLGYGENSINYFPLTGDNKIVTNAVPFLISQGLKFKIVLDYNRSKQSGNPIDILNKNFCINSDYLYEIPCPVDFKNMKSSGVEDLFTKKDFKKFVLDHSSKVSNNFKHVSNSNFVKKMPKSGLAVNFYQNVKENQIALESFNSDTIDSFKKVLNFCANNFWFGIE